jgi:hypothetical protein
MEFIAFIALPLLLGVAIMAGLLILVKIMPGDGKAVPAAAAAAAAERGPNYEQLASKRKAAFRIGWVMLVWLGILTIAEIVTGLILKSTSLLLVVNILEAASILYVFMHIKTVWSSEEAH